MRLIEGVKVPAIKTRDIYGRCIDFNELAGGKTYIGFLRNVDCLFCNLRVNSLLKDVRSLKEKGLRVILFIQNDPELIKDVLLSGRDLPFFIIADPRMKFYKKFGVETSLLGLMLSMFNIGKIKNGLKMGLGIKFFQRGKMNLMPADFLINENLTIKKAYYGQNTGDHLRIQDIATFAN